MDGDAVAGITLVGDALDGAATVGLTSLSDRIETVRESFLATTLHDVRQPITLAEGSLLLADRWLTEPGPDTARVAEAVHDALLATTELVAMIDTLSDASRVAMGALNRISSRPASNTSSATWSARSGRRGELASGSRSNTAAPDRDVGSQPPAAAGRQPARQRPQVLPR